jgi:aminopeptidase
MTIPDFDQKVTRYADVIARVGLNLQPGQWLFINAPLLAAPLVHQIAAIAYQIGCRYVDMLWRDEQLDLVRFQHAPEDSFTEYPVYRAEGVFQHLQDGGAYLSITGDDPDLLQDQDADKITTARKTAMTHMKPIYDLLNRRGFNWAVVSYPTLPWARAVFPQASSTESVERLWQSIFRVCRIDQPEPVAAWQAHIADLQSRAAYLTAKQYHALHYTAPGTDLTLGLAEQHIWRASSSVTSRGTPFTANLPTEEIFTLPHRQRIDGVVSATLPLSHDGKLIEGIQLTFEKGRVTAARAQRGEDILLKMLEMDEGMSSLGEAALVPHSSPVAQSGTLFFNTLLDENAACHIALGNGYNDCTQDGETLSEDEYAARGGNSSLGHVDFMIGSGEMDIDGVLPDGRREAVMRSGEWAF